MIARLVSAMAVVAGAVACATPTPPGPADAFTVELELYERIHHEPPDFFLVSERFADVAEIPAGASWSGIPVFVNAGQVDVVVAVGESPAGLRLSRIPTIEPVADAPAAEAAAPPAGTGPSAPGTPSGSPPAP